MVVFATPCVTGWDVFTTPGVTRWDSSATPGVTGWVVLRRPVLQGRWFLDARCYRVGGSATPGVTGCRGIQKDSDNLHCITTTHVSKRSSYSTLHILSTETLGFTSAFEPGKCPITNFCHKPWLHFDLAVLGLETSANRFGAEDSISHKALAAKQTREAFMFHPMFHALFEAT